MQNSDFTIHNSNIMIIGFGRIGKILAKMLQGIGANVYMVVNSNDKAALANSYGYHPISIEKITDYVGNMNIIYNTVPKTILNNTNMNKINKNCLIIDLASAPFGVDFEHSKDFGLTVLYANSLPGKVAPLTAALYIKETIYSILENM